MSNSVENYKERIKSIQPCSVFAVGTVDVDYQVQIHEKDESGKSVVVWTCPYYARWKAMLRRCYGDRTSSNPARVCSDWLYLSNFKALCIEQGWDLSLPFEIEKDILIRGCRLYSPATVCFVPKSLNNAFRSDTSKSVEQLEKLKAEYIASVDVVDNRVLRALDERISQAITDVRVKADRKAKEKAKRQKAKSKPKRKSTRKTASKQNAVASA